MPSFRQAQDQEDFEEERGEGVTFGKRFDVVAQELLGFDELADKAPGLQLQLARFRSSLFRVEAAVACDRAYEAGDP